MATAAPIRTNRRAALAVASAILISTLLIVLTILATLPGGYQPPGRWFDVEMAGCLLVLIVESGLLLSLFDSLWPAGMPVATRVALRWRRMPLALRPIMALWWAAHFAVGIFMAFLAEMGIAYAARHGHGRIGVGIQLIVFFVTSFTLANAFNLYAMLTLTACGAGERAVQVAWRWRFLLDFLIAAAAAGLVTFLPT